MGQPSDPPLHPVENALPPNATLARPKPKPGPPLVRLNMVRPALDRLPVWPLPAGFILRGFQEGDDSTWAGIVAAADPHQEVTAARFHQAFGKHADELARRQLYLLGPGGQPIGTTTAWQMQDAQGVDWGRVHWLAILPAWQGRGLSKTLLGATLARLSELGHRRARLVTESFRRVAIRLYLDFGFVPEVCGEEDRVAWSHMRSEGFPVEIPAAP